MNALCSMVVNAALGAGMLNFPFAFLKAGGIINSIGLQQLNSQLNSLFFTQLNTKNKQLFKLDA